MTIGEVLAVLKPEFHDITVSKLRFLEGAGLVSPERTAAGYRKFSDDDVARLRFILRTQRDQYLPLRVIRQRLTDLEASGGLNDLDSTAARMQPPDDHQRGNVDGDGDRVAAPTGPATQLTREELCKAAGRDPAELALLEAFGLISPRGDGDRDAWYTQDDLLVLRLAGELLPFGLEPRHLRMYKLFADREAALFEQVTAPMFRQRNPDAQLQARQTVETLTALCAQLHAALLRGGLSRADQEPPR